jgi:Flp pilus assembly protein TadD
VVTSDHGEGLDEHGEMAHGIFAYESTLRVPLIIAQVGGGAPASPAASGSTNAPPGEVSSISARHIDILPTILEAAGRPVPSGLPGRTLLPREERTAEAAQRPTYFEAMSGMLNHGWAPLTGVLAGREKFIDLPIPERYDLAADPGERANLSGASPERDRMLAAMLSSLDVRPPGERITEDRETRDRLRALGYVSADAERKADYTEADDPKRLIDLDRAIHDAIDAFNEGRTEEAQRIYQHVIERRPGMAFPYRRLALIEWRQGNAAGAVAILRRAVATGVVDPRLRAQLGEYLTGMGQTAEGIGILEPLANGPASDAEILNALAIAYERAGAGDKSRQTFERLVAAMPGSSVPFENLGVLALAQGDVAGAKWYFERALAIEPGSSRAYTGVGATALRRGDRRAAYEAWGRAVTLDRANYEAMYNLGVNLAREGRMTEARPYLNEFLKNAPPAQHADQLKVVAILLQ